MDQKNSYRVSLATLAYVGSFGLFFFSLNLISAFYAGQYAPVLCLAFFDLIAVFFLLCSGTYFVDEHVIEQHCFIGKYQIHWQDIDRIELGGQGSYVFYAGAQRFILLPSIYWSGKDKNAFEQFINQKIQASHLTVESSLIADLMWHKNTRI
ncbi:hypothetical protein SAMN05421749_103117 [Acinetobacter marinus]|uniref:YcxB-like protein n=1 Tax=Acinetobacter marinus TaxID=281375 RepID=A0A1G6ISD6_9GAMM|nr:hypothetical protein [Acinetobacter marinus]SDC08656.1 hypothetical protein SAMN05421749_103117 [Acinetobacter marinus]